MATSDCRRQTPQSCPNYANDDVQGGRAGARERERGKEMRRLKKKNSRVICIPSSALFLPPLSPVRLSSSPPLAPPHLPFPSLRLCPTPLGNSLARLNISLPFLWLDVNEILRPDCARLCMNVCAYVCVSWLVQVIIKIPVVVVVVAVVMKL